MLDHRGLNGNRWAILIKIHHCMAGAMSAAHLLARLCDDADGSAFANNVDIKQIPPYGDARSWAETLWRMSVSIAGAVCTAAARAVSWPAVTSPAGPVTTRRRYQAVRVPRDAVDAVCHKFGVTANDVALAAITEGFRTVLLHRGQQPRADSLRTLEKTDGSSAMLPYLPVEYDDPVRRLRTVHNRSQQSGRRQPDSLSDYTPLMLCAKMIHALARLPQQGIVTLATSAPRPRHQLRLMGQKMDQVLPIPPTALQLSTGIAVLSYGDELVFGITADYDAASEMQQLVNGIELGVARLVALSDDSVLLFTKDRRKRSSRALPSAARRGRPSVPTARARH